MTPYNCLEELTIDAIQLLKPGMAVCICNAALRRQGYMVDLYEFEICVLFIASLRTARVISEIQSQNIKYKMWIQEIALSHFQNSTEPSTISQPWLH